MGAKDALSFLSSIASCELGASFEGRVQSQSNSTVSYMARRLEELARPGGRAEDYRDEAKALITQMLSIPTGSPIPEFKLRLDGDLLEIRLDAPSSRSICLRMGKTFEERVELLVHELTHLAAPDTAGIPILELARLGDPIRYGQRAVSQPGDELDAFVNEISARIQLRGRKAVTPPAIGSLFDDSGNLIGPKDRIRDWILHELAYQRIRYAPEYLENLKGARIALTRRKQMLLQLVNIRTDQERRYLEALKARSSAEEATLAREAGLSRTRTLREISEVERDLAAIDKQLR